MVDNQHTKVYFKNHILTFRAIKERFLETGDNKKKIRDCSNKTKELHAVHVSNAGDCLHVAKLNCN